MPVRIMKRLIVLLLLALFTSGCFGSRETDEITYVTAIGVDAAEGGKVDVSYRLAVAAALGGGDSGGKTGPEKAGEVITIRTSNLAEARNLLNSVVARAPYLSQIQTLVIGEPLARKGIKDLIGPLMRFREFRGTMYVVVANNDSAAKFMMKNNPKFEILTSKYFETLFLNANLSSYFMRTRLQDFYVDLKSNSASPVAALMGINPKNLEGNPKRKLSPGEKVDEYTAGGIPRRGGGNDVEAAGTALFHKDKMVGKLTTEETRMLAILKGQYSEGYIVVADPQIPKESVNINLKLGHRPKIKVEFVDGVPNIHVKLLLEGEITSIPSGIHYEQGELTTQLEDTIKSVVEEEIMKMLKKTQELQTDPAGFGYHARQQFATLQDYMAIDWENLYSQANIQVDLTVQIRRTGLMLQTSPIQ